MSALLSPAIRKALVRLPLLFCIGLFLFHLSVIRRYAVNIPNMDDWTMFSAGNHPASLDRAWLFGLNNEHRTATTRFFVWLQFQVNGWNIRTHLLMDFIIYGFFLAALVWFARRVAPDISIWIVWTFVVFLLSPIIWLEHFMAYPVAVHFWVLFFFISAYFLFSEDQKWSCLLAGCGASILSSYSFASGVATSFVLLLAFWMFKGLRAYEAAAKTKERSREIRQLLLVTGLIGASLIGWMIGYEKPPYHGPLTFPYAWSFWRFFLNLVPGGFGIGRISSVWGMICLLIILVPICGEVWKQRGKLSSAHWAGFAAVAALLGNLALISMGRTSLGIDQSRAIEYVEHALPLLILSVLNWGVFLRGRSKLRLAVTAALWLFCCFTFRNDWDFGIYRSAAAERTENVRCVKAYYEGTGDGRCPKTYPVALHVLFVQLMEQAKRVNASFYQEMHVRVPSDRKTVSRNLGGWPRDQSKPGAALDDTFCDADAPVMTRPANSREVSVLVSSGCESVNLHGENR